MKKGLYKHEHLVLNEHAIVSATDRAGRITHANDKFCAISGFSREELIGQNHRLVKSGLHPPQLYDDLWRTISRGKVWRGEICNRRKDGSFYWVESTIVPFVDNNGNPYEYVSIRTDITRLKLAEHALRRQAELQQMLTSSTALLLNTPAEQFSSAIETILQRSGEFLGADRAYLFLYSDDGCRMSNTHEWCAPGISTERDKIQAMALNSMPWWWRQISQRGFCIVADVAALPAEASAEKAIFEDQNIQSLFAFPLQKNAETFGFIGFDAVRSTQDWRLEEIQPFAVLADNIASTITQQRAERAMEHHRERLRLSQIHANIGTWDWNVQTGELYWTERIAPLFGYPQGELETTYINFLKAVHPDDRQAVQHAVDNALNNQDTYEIEHRVLWPDGSVHWVMERGAVIRDNATSALHMLGVVQDIDSRKRAELALTEREQQLREAQAIAQVGSWEVDIATDRLTGSDEALRILGKDPGSALPASATIRSVIHPDDLPRLKAAKQQSRATDAFGVNLRIFRSNGAVRQVHILAHVKRNGTGGRAKITGTIQDITERIEAENRLKESEQRLGFAVEGAGDGIWDCNLLTRKLTVSGLYETILGYNRGELASAGYCLATGIHPEDLALVEKALEDYLSGKNPKYTLEIRMRCKDGSYKWVLTRATVVEWDEQGRAIRMVGINSDISERKRVEEALIASRQEADRANHAKSQFLSSMSHELRTPMNAILGFSQLLETDETLNAEQQDNVHEILKAGHHLLELINEVLDLAKVESGRIDLSLEPLEVLPIVEECLSLIAPLGDRYRIGIHHAVADRLTVRADRTRLKQVLINLLSNAIKYNHPQGTVSVRTQLCCDDRLRLMISDTGRGIPAHRMHELFQPFNRLDAGNSEVEGTGIGLTITERLVEMMGGSIGVESELGTGSTFWIELPLEDSPVSSSELSGLAWHCDEQVESFQDAQHLVLYIEDNPANLKLVAQMLGRRKHINLITAHSPELGIELALAHQPELILLDINMPGMDGYQVLDVFKAHPNLQQIPVAAITANAMPADVLRGIGAGFSAYLTKPLDMVKLFNLLDRFLTINREHTR